MIIIIVGWHIVPEWCFRVGNLPQQSEALLRSG